MNFKYIFNNKKMESSLKEILWILLLKLDISIISSKCAYMYGKEPDYNPVFSVCTQKNTNIPLEPLLSAPRT